MRLLNTSTLIVEEFLSQKLPEYVILSHTWDQEEVTLDDMRSGRAIEMKGYAKVTGCCQKALSDGFNYCWIDTCCIDKTSSSELSEAINSMYRWYEGSCICYVYLTDVTRCDKPLVAGQVTQYHKFDASRWFKRGWTLQELIAPVVVEFYDKDWKEIGTKEKLRHQIATNTGIDIDVLAGKSPRSCNVAVRLSWASHRETTRLEDEAYCLLGLFGVNMPLLYGDGQQAFRRLQEEILRVEEDYSLFVWHDEHPAESGFKPNESRGLLASKTSDFAKLLVLNLGSNMSPGNLTPRQLSKGSSSIFAEPENHLPPCLTSRGVRISLPLMHIGSGNPQKYWACMTLASWGSKDSYLLCMPVVLVKGTNDRYAKPRTFHAQLIPKSESHKFQRKMIYIDQPIPQNSISRFTSSDFMVRWDKNDSMHIPPPHMITLRVVSDHGEHLDRCAAPMLEMRVPTLLRSVSYHNVIRFPVHGLDQYSHHIAVKLNRLAPEELSRSVVDKDSCSCYFVQSNSFKWVAFRFKRSLLAFVVGFKILNDRARCRAWSIDSKFFDVLVNKPNQYRTGPELPRTSETDHVTLEINADGGAVKGKVEARIRQIASFDGEVLKCARFVLSIKAEELST
jgi:hypothetical protein